MPQWVIPEEIRLKERIQEEQNRILELTQKKVTPTWQPELPTWQPPEQLPYPMAEQLIPKQPTASEVIELWRPRVEQPTPIEEPKYTAPTLPLGYGQFLKPQEYAPVPWYRQAIEKLMIPFELLHQKVEVPGAAVLTSPFSPQLPWEAGEGWVEHEKREYEVWKAPKFVKGVTEFAVSLPLFMIPYGGLSLAGSKALARATTAIGLAKVARVIEETGKILPAVEKGLNWPMEMAGKGLAKAVTKPVTVEVLGETEKGITVGLIKLKSLKRMAEEGFKPDHARMLSERFSKVPGFEWFVRKIDPSVLAYQPEARLTIAYGRQMAAGEASVRGLLMPEIMGLPSPKVVFGIDDLGFAGKVKPKVAGAELDMDSIVRFPSHYDLTPDQFTYVMTHINTWAPMRAALKEAGILERELATEIAEGGYLGRIALEFVDEMGKRIPIRSGGRAIGAKMPGIQPRKIESYADAVAGGYRYETDPRAVLYIRLMQGFKALIDKEYIGEMMALPGVRTIGMKAMPERIARDTAASQVRNTKFILDRLRRASRGEKLTAQSLKAIRNKNPEVADFLEGKSRLKVQPEVAGIPTKVTPALGVEAAYTASEVGNMQAELSGLKEWILTEPSAKLTGLIKKTGWSKGEISDLTLKQYRDITGKTAILPNILTADKKHVRWEYSLDDIATEMGYDSGDALRDAITKTGEATSRMRALETELRGITPEMIAPEISIVPPVTEAVVKEVPVELESIKAVIKRLQGQYAGEAKLAIQARQGATEAMGKAGRTVEEGTIWQPGFGNRLFPKETAEYMNKTLIESRINPFMGKIGTISGVIRFAQTGVDLGPYFLQGLPTFFTKPGVWAKNVGISMQGLFDERSFYNWLALPKQQETLAKLIPEGFVLNVAEMVEAAPILAKIPGIGGFFNRWARWFNFALDGGRILEAQAMLPIVEKAGPEGVRALVDHLGKKWGVMSMRWLGIPEGQRQAENAVLFYASRWTRSGIAMMKDIGRGGIEGALARDMIGRMMLGMTMMYYGFCKALGQEPNLDPSGGKFMTIQIGTDHIGFGGMYIALARFAGNTLRSLAENPKGFITLDSRDNPLVRFWRGRVAPVTGVGWDIMTGRTFVGEPVDSFPNFSKYVALRNMVPFWLQGYAQGVIGAEPMPGIGAVGSEFFGMRTWPLQPWERREDLRETYAQMEYSKPWAELKVLDRRQLEKKHSDLQDITEEAWKQSIKRGRPSQVAYGQWRGERDAVNQKYEQGLWEMQARVDKGEISGYDFRLVAQKLGAARAFALDRIDERPEYKDVVAALNEPRIEPEVTPQFEDLAYDVYTKLMFAGDLEIGIAEYNYEEADKRRQWFIATFGQQVYDYVIERVRQGRDVPPLMQEYYRAQEVLRPYWKVKEEAIKIYGEPQTKWQENRLNDFISRTRKRLRRMNPQIEKYFSMFYKQV